MQSSQKPTTSSTVPSDTNFDGYVTGTTLVDATGDHNVEMDQVGTYLISEPLPGPEHIPAFMATHHGEGANFDTVRKTLDATDDEVMYILGRLAALSRAQNELVVDIIHLGNWSGGNDSGFASLDEELAMELEEWERDMLDGWIHTYLGYGSYAGPFSTSGSIWFDSSRLAIVGEGHESDDEVVELSSEHFEYECSEGLIPNRCDPIDSTFWVELGEGVDPDDPDAIRNIINMKDGPLLPELLAFHTWITEHLTAFSQKLDDGHGSYYEIETDYADADCRKLTLTLRIGADSGGESVGFVIGLCDDNETNDN